MVRNMLILLVSVLAVMFVSVAPALAEFTSQSEKSDKGEGEITEMTLEAGGGKISCLALGESESKAIWTIESGGKEANKGPGLLVNVGTWGKCTAVASGLKSEAAVSECGIELTQTKTEEEVAGRDAKTCTVKAATCELQIEPESNKTLSTFDAYPSGESNENIDITPTVKGVTTKVNEACKTDGISASKEGQLKGLGRVIAVKPQQVPEFRVFVAPFRLSSTNNVSTITFARVSGVQAKLNNGRRIVPTLANQFTLQEPNLKKCSEEIDYIVGEACHFTSTYNKAIGVGRQTFMIWGANGVITEDYVAGD